MLTRNLPLIATCVGVVVFAASMAIDWLLFAHSERAVAVVASNALAALVTAALVFTVLAFGRRQRLEMETRMEALLEVNHHIRNALQSLTFAAGSLKNRQERESEAVSEAIQRIQWALREVLPKVEPAYEPFEGSARAVVTRPPKNNH